MMSTGNDLQKLSLSQEALIHHTKLECYQAGYLWRESIDTFDLPDPKSWGSEKKSYDKYGPLWESTQISRKEMTFISTCFCGVHKCKKRKFSKALIKALSSNCV